MPMPPREPASSIPSPCVRNCCLDENDVCMGCGRHLQEILRWHHADDAEREAILERSRERRADRTRRFPLAPRG